MKIFDPHVHMTSRTTDDYEAMAPPASSPSSNRRSGSGSRARSSAASSTTSTACSDGSAFARAVRHPALLHDRPESEGGQQPDAGRGSARAVAALLDKDGVVAVGEIGFDDQTDAEEACFARQIELARAHDLPILIHTPHRDKKRGTIRSIELVRR